jgi:hypothetical protein
MQQQIAAEKSRGAQAAYDAQRQVIGLGMNDLQRQGVPTGETFNGAPVLIIDGQRKTGEMVNGILTYAGGGYTGNAPRSGGLDGKGGFMAMLHPRETVIDHTRAGGGRGSSTPTSISIPIQTGPVYQLPDGTDTVSVQDFQAGMQALAAGIMGQLGTPAGRMALRGA